MEGLGTYYLIITRGLDSYQPGWARLKTSGDSKILWMQVTLKKFGSWSDMITRCRVTSKNMSIVHIKETFFSCFCCIGCVKFDLFCGYNPCLTLLLSWSGSYSCNFIIQLLLPFVIRDVIPTPCTETTLL